VPWRGGGRHLVDALNRHARPFSTADRKSGTAWPTCVSRSRASPITGRAVSVSANTRGAYRHLWIPVHGSGSAAMHYIGMEAMRLARRCANTPPTECGCPFSWPVVVAFARRQTVICIRGGFGCEMVQVCGTAHNHGGRHSNQALRGHGGRELVELPRKGVDRPPRGGDLKHGILGIAAVGMRAPRKETFGWPGNEAIGQRLGT